MITSVSASWNTIKSGRLTLNAASTIPKSNREDRHKKMKELYERQVAKCKEVGIFDPIFSCYFHPQVSHKLVTYGISTSTPEHAAWNRSDLDIVRLNGECHFLKISYASMVDFIDIVKRSDNDMKIVSRFHSHKTDDILHYMMEESINNEEMRLVDRDNAMDYYKHGGLNG